MRRVSITVHNNQQVEVFTEALEEGFELWMVGTLAGRRTVLTHYLTHDDVEARLEYARRGDLNWIDAARSAIPREKHPAALEWEDSIKRGAFVDNDKKLLHSVISHFDVINLLPIEKNACKRAKEALLGRWADDAATIVFLPDSKLRWSCPLDRPHPLNVGARTHGYEPDWWSFASWQLHLMNAERKCGMRLGVIRVDQNELHVVSDRQDHLAHVLRRGQRVS